MKKAIRIIFVFAIALCLSLTAFALTTDEVSGKYEATSCIGVDDGERYVCQGDYIYLGPNGSGEISYDGTLYDISWDVDGREISGTDCDGYDFFGSLEDGELSIRYAGYDYTFVPVDAEENVAGKDESTKEEDSGNKAVSSSGSSSASSASDDTFDFSYYDRIFRDLPYVCDFAGILSESEAESLSERAADISENYEVNVYIMTVKDMKDFGVWNIEDFTEALRTGYRPGYGDDGDMIILALSMAERDYDLAVWGSKGHNAFTDFGCNRIENAFLDDFKNNKWFSGFDDYLDQCEKLLRLESQGKPLDSDSNPLHSALSVIIALLIGWLIALAIASGLKKSMKAPGLQKDANSYIPNGGAEITQRTDTYTHTTESRQYSPRQSSSSSGGGGGGYSSSGGSHHSGKF